MLLRNDCYVILKFWNTQKEYLPFNKSLYIDACIYLPYRVDEFLRSLSDRELRIRAPIEEIRMLLDIPEGETERMPDNQNAVEPKTEENPDDTVEIIESVHLLEKNKERAQDCFDHFQPIRTVLNLS